MKKRTFGLLVLLVAILIASCGTKISLETTTRSMTDALEKDFETFYQVVELFESIEGEIDIYKGKGDVVSDADDYVKKIDDLYIVTSIRLNDDYYDILYEKAAPLFDKYNLYSILNSLDYGGTVRFIFESEFGQQAFLEYSKDNVLSKTTLMVVDKIHIKECWFAVIISD